MSRAGEPDDHDLHPDDDHDRSEYVGDDDDDVIGKYVNGDDLDEHVDDDDGDYLEEHDENKPFLHFWTRQDRDLQANICFVQ